MSLWLLLLSNRRKQGPMNYWTLTVVLARDYAESDLRFHFFGPSEELKFGTKAPRRGHMYPKLDLHTPQPPIDFSGMPSPVKTSVKLRFKKSKIGIEL